MTNAKYRLFVFFLVLVAQMVPASAAEFERYTNARFGVTGLVPAGYIMQPAPYNGDGHSFLSPDGHVSLKIYGSYDAVGDVPEYRKFLLVSYSTDGEVTYQAGGKNWFVLSGYEDSRIFYLRVEKVRDCDGVTVYAHMNIDYPTFIRSSVDPLLNALGRGLGMAPC